MLPLAATAHRRRAGRALCEHAFADMRDRGIAVVAIGNGGDAFHAAALAFYSSLGCTELPTSVHYKQL